MRKILIAIMLIGAIFTVGCEIDTSINAEETGEEVSAGKSYYPEGEEIVIEPNEISDDGIKILNLLDEDVSFYDVDFNKEVKGYKIEVWGVQNKEWTIIDKIERDVNFEEFENLEIAIRAKEESIIIYATEEKIDSVQNVSEVHTVANEVMLQDINKDVNSFEELVKDCTFFGEFKILDTRDLRLNEEIIVWSHIGFSEDVKSISNDTNFREEDVEEGVMVTFTVLD